MPEPIENTDHVIYTPASIISVFNSAINVSAERKLIIISGIYNKTGQKEYKGYYYDQLSDDGGGYTLTVITSSLKREQVQENKLITFMGFVTRRITKEGNIAVQINLDNLLEQTESKFTEEDLKRQELLKKKFDIGIKDVNALIKRKIFGNEIINIGLITGESGNIDKDITSSVGAANSYFNLNFNKANLSSPDSVISNLKGFDIDNQIDFIVVARGGGSGLEHFEDLNLCEALLSIEKPVVSAIGHQPDKTLFERMSDKSFITPTAFGNYLKDITERFVSELNDSRAKIIEDTKKMLDKQYEEKIKNYEEAKKENDKLLVNYQSSLSGLQKDMEKIKKSVTTKSIVGVIIGLVIGFLFALIYMGNI